MIKDLFPTFAYNMSRPYVLFLVVPLLIGLLCLGSRTARKAGSGRDLLFFLAGCYAAVLGWHLL